VSASRTNTSAPASHPWRPQRLPHQLVRTVTRPGYRDMLLKTKTSAAHMLRDASNRRRAPRVALPVMARSPRVVPGAILLPREKRGPVHGWTADGAARQGRSFAMRQLNDSSMAVSSRLRRLPTRRSNGGSIAVWTVAVFGNKRVLGAHAGLMTVRRRHRRRGSAAQIALCGDEPTPATLPGYPNL